MITLLQKVALTTLLFCAMTCSVTLPGGVSADIRYTVLTDEFLLETLTVYHPVIGQCDNDPLLTASNKRIDTLKLRSGELRWIALSRDMLRGWGGSLQYGDTVHLSSGDHTIDGTWVIQDTMNKRYQRFGDLLFDPSRRSRGKWHQVKITRHRKVYAGQRGSKEV